jgi:dipeptidyl aminopeptidase/acylaminoacyl peptidase
VLQVNYRGSSGYGRAFTQAAKGEFAAGMHSDLLDGLDTLVAQGITDPHKVAIMGASYGGYASLVGMTFTPERFACGISLFGMSDLASLLENAPPYWELNKPWWMAYVGDPAKPEERAVMDTRSPLRRAAQVQGPLLLLHGALDARVKVDQSMRMAQALRNAGKAVDLHVYARAGHGLHRWPDRLDYFRRTEDFLAQCLGGRSSGFDFYQLGSWAL